MNFYQQYLFNKLKLFTLLFLLTSTNNIFSADIDYIYNHYNIPSYSNYSTLGLIQNPNARFYPAGTIGITISDMDPYYRGSVMAYPFEWAEFAYQYTDVNNALYSLSESFSGRQTYKDKGFDAKFRLLKERDYLPQIAVGFRDPAGTGLFSAEYIVASKMMYTNKAIFDLSFGIGWGALSHQDLKNPLIKLSNNFKTRSRQPSDTQGGEFSWGKYFSGDIGIFGGAEIFLPNLRGLRLKVEYDGTDYMQEGFPLGNEKFALEPVKKSQSRINYGIVFPVTKSLHAKASFAKGNTFNLGISFSGLWGKKNPITKKRDPFKKIENTEIIQEVTSRDDLLLYRASLAELRKQKLYLQSAHKNGDTLAITYSQGTHRDFARVSGRVIRTLDAIAPKEITKFKIIDDNAGMSLNQLNVDREAFKRYQKDNLYALTQNTLTTESVKYSDKKYFAYQPSGDYPSHFFNISPNLRSQIGGPDGFYFGEVSIGVTSEIKFARNISLVTEGQIGIGNNFDSLKLKSDSVLPHVRSDIVLYLKESKDYNIRRMQLNIFNNPTKNLYTKFTAGILEDMFSGIGGEVLYRPFSQNFAFGFEAWAVQQRDYNMMFESLDYKTVTGHANFYFMEPNTRILFNLKGGKYLAKDSGFTFDFSRVFPSGLQMGAFFSLTDISKAEFGEGSFDKGFYFHIPVEIFFDRFARGYTSFGLKPLTRDGAAILAPSFNLYGVTYEAQRIFIENDWSDLYD